MDTEKRNNRAMKIFWGFLFSCVVIMNFQFLPSALQIIKNRTYPVVTGNIINTSEVDTYLAPLVNIQLQIEGSNDAVYAITGPYVLKCSPEKAQFRYSGNPNEEVFLFEYEENPFFILIFLNLSIVVIWIFLSKKNKRPEDNQIDVDKSNWKEIVSKLYNDPNWASHVLATGLIDNSNIVDSNLGAALEVCTAEEIIRGVLFAYDDDSAQPYCDAILSKFETIKVFECFKNIENLTSNMQKWFLLFIDEYDKTLANEILASIDEITADDDFKKVINFVRTGEEI